MVNALSSVKPFLRADPESFLCKAEDGWRGFVGMSLERSYHVIKVGFKVSRAGHKKVIIDVGDDRQLELRTEIA